MDLKEAKCQWNRFRGLLVTSIVLAVICVVCLISGIAVKNSAYASLIGISPATDPELRKESYLNAISLAPNQIKAYLYLLDIFNEDGVFDKEESQTFLSVYNANKDKLDTHDSDYSVLHYTAGFLYVNGYDDNATARLRMGLPFLEIAEEFISQDDPNYLAIECYCRIGEYYRDYIWDAGSSIREVPPEQMQAILDDVVTTLDAFRENNYPDSVYNRLGFCVAVCNLLYDQRDILAATVPYESVVTVIDAIYLDLPQENTLQKDQTKQLLWALTENKAQYLDMLDRAYARKENR